MSLSTIGVFEAIDIGSSLRWSDGVSGVGQLKAHTNVMNAIITNLSNRSESPNA
jgi:hypothetical protein